MPNVIYHGNGNTTGVTTPVSYEMAENAVVTVLAYWAIDSTPNWSKLHFNFVSWTSNADGSGVSYAVDSTFVMPAGDVNLYAKWHRFEWAYILHEGTGTILDSNGITGTAQDAAYIYWKNIFEKTGYTITSWTSNADGSGISYLQDITGLVFIIPVQITDIELYAQWSELLCITYNSNTGGNSSSRSDLDFYVKGYPRTISSQDKGFSNLPNTFAQWNTQADGKGIPYPLGSTILTGNVNVTLYAIWNIMYVVHFDTANFDNSYYADITYLADTNTNITIPPLIDNSLNNADVYLLYTQIGWGISSDSTGVILLPGAVISLKNTNLTLFSVVIPKYSIIFNINIYLPPYQVTLFPRVSTSNTVSTSFVLTQDYTINSTTNPPSTGIINGEHKKFIFKNWNTSPDGLGTAYNVGDTITIFKNNINLYAQWQRVFRFIFSLVFPNNTDKNCYVYADVNDRYTFKAFKDLAYASDVPIDKVFVGWNSHSDGSGVRYNKGDIFVVVDKTELILYPQWVTGVAVSLNSNYVAGDINSNPNSIFYKTVFAGNLSSIDPVLVGSSLTITNSFNGTLTNTSCVILGWTTSSDGSGTMYVVGDTLVVTAPITLYAKWGYMPMLYYYSLLMVNRNGDKPYPVVLDPQGNYYAKVRDDPTLMYGQKFRNPDDAENYLFSVDSPWFKMPNSNLWAIWYYDFDLAHPADTTKAKFYTITSIASELEASAIWLLTLKRVPQGTRYHIGTPFVASDGTIDATHTLARPASVLLGWKTYGTNAQHSFGEAITLSDFLYRNDYYLMADWLVSAQVVYLTTDSTGGWVPASKVYIQGDTVIVQHSTLYRSHYILKGWRHDGVVFHEGDTFIMPGAAGNQVVDFNLSPVWEAIPRVDYYPNGYTMVVPTFNSYFEGDIVTVEFVGAHLDTQRNLEFRGWNVTLNGIQLLKHVGETFIMPNANVKLYAVWDHLYSISFVYATDDIDILSVKEGTPLSLKTRVLTKNDLQFSHWTLLGVSYPDGFTFTVNNNYTFVAVWKPLDVVSTNDFYTVYVKH